MAMTLREKLVHKYGYSSYKVLQREIGPAEARKFANMFLMGSVIAVWVVIAIIVVLLNFAMLSISPEQKNIWAVIYSILLLLITSSLGYFCYLNLALYRKHGIILYNQRMGTRLILPKNKGLFTAISRNVTILSSLVGLGIGLFFPLLIISIVLTGKL